MRNKARVRATFLVVLSLVALAGLVLVLKPTASSCPDIRYPSSDLSVNGYTRDRIAEAIKRELGNPDTYELRNVEGLRDYVKDRADGSSYYTRVNVYFRAETGMGGQVLDRIRVNLRETGGGECHVY